METTGADANDEFARWLAETAKAGQAADQATSGRRAAQATPPAPPAGAPSMTPLQPVAPPPPAAPLQPAASPPAPVPPATVPPATVPPGFQAGTMPPPPSAAPEFFGGVQPAPPTRPYEAPFAGPQISRESFQPAGDPPAAAPFGSPPPAAAPPPPSAPAPASAVPPAAPAWAPGYAAPAGDAFSAPPAAAPGMPFFPPPDAAAPVAPYPADSPAAFPPAPPAAPVAPVAPAASAPVAPAAPVYEPAAPVLPPLVPDAVPGAGALGGDPLGSLFDAEADTAARLAASPPPGAAPPPLAAPPAGTQPSDHDPMASLFGGLAETSEGPVVATPDLFASAPPAPAAPVYTPEPAFAAPPVAPVAPPAAPAPVAPAPELAYVAAAPVAPAAATAAGYSPPADNDPTAGTQFFGGGQGSYEEPPDLDRTTAGEKIAFVLAFIVPPAGLIASIVAAAQSARHRGWVHGFVKAALTISLVTTIAAGIGGAFAYKAFDDAQKHAALEAASAQFCATVAEQPDMITLPTFGFPGPGASIPETVESIQAFVDRWDALASVSPSGIRPGVTRVADVAREILGTIEETRLVDNELNVANMSAVASGSGVVEWAAEYCG